MWIRAGLSIITLVTGLITYLSVTYVQPLQQKQVILFSPTSDKVFLFHHNKVYTVGMEEAPSTQHIDISLPKPISLDVFILLSRMYLVLNVLLPDK